MSRIDLCTGMFVRREKLVGPKSKPKTEIKMPQSRSLWPSIPPRNFTEDKSGNLRLASPPASFAPPAMAPAEASSIAEAAAENLAARVRDSELLWDQALYSQVRMNDSSKKICG